VTLPDPALTVFDFGHEFHVVCPRCGRHALVVDRGADASLASRVALTCAQCGLAQFWAQSGPGVLTSADPHTYPAGLVAVGGAARPFARPALTASCPRLRRSRWRWRSWTVSGATGG